MNGDNLAARQLRMIREGRPDTAVPITPRRQPVDWRAILEGVGVGLCLFAIMAAAYWYFLVKPALRL